MVRSFAHLGALLLASALAGPALGQPPPDPMTPAPGDRPSTTRAERGAPPAADALSGGQPRRDGGATASGTMRTDPATTTDRPLPPAGHANPQGSGPTQPGSNPALGRGG